MSPAGATAVLEREPDAQPGQGQSRRTHARHVPRPRAPRHRMLLMCTAVLAAGLFGVLLLNTIISQGAFRQHELEVDLILTSEHAEDLARQVQLAESPLEMEKAARGLGMVPAASPVFLRLSDGTILGEPVPAPEPTAAVDFADAPGPRAVTPAPSASASAGASAVADPLAEVPTVADPSLGDPTAIDPALDPATGLDTGTTTDPAAGPAATPTPAPAASTAGGTP